MSGSGTRSPRLSTRPKGNGDISLAELAAKITIALFTFADDASKELNNAQDALRNLMQSSGSENDQDAHEANAKFSVGKHLTTLKKTNANIREAINSALDGNVASGNIDTVQMTLRKLKEAILPELTSGEIAVTALSKLQTALAESKRMVAELQATKFALAITMDELAEVRKKNDALKRENDELQTAPSGI